jgi:hypothetical protein
MERLVRYAIQLPDGSFARPGRVATMRTTMKQAKLWRTRGHVTQHLQHTARRYPFRQYPAGTKVVEVVLTTEVTPVIDVDQAMAEFAKVAASKKAKHEIEHARRELESARMMMERATAQAAKMGIR